MTIFKTYLVLFRRYTVFRFRRTYIPNEEYIINYIATNESWWRWQDLISSWEHPSPKKINKIVLKDGKNVFLLSFHFWMAFICGELLRRTAANKKTKKIYSHILRCENCLFCWLVARERNTLLNAITLGVELQHRTTSFHYI